MDETDGLRHHYLEPGTPSTISTLINARAAVVYAQRSQPGAGGYLTCLGTVLAWHGELQAAGIHVDQLGRATDNRTWHTGGGYLRPGEAEPSDHHWLAVGDCLWLFDPAASNIESNCSPDVSRYIAFDGRPFPEWRIDRIRSSLGRP